MPNERDLWKELRNVPDAFYMKGYGVENLANIPRALRSQAGHSSHRNSGAPETTTQRMLAPPSPFEGSNSSVEGQRLHRTSIGATSGEDTDSTRGSLTRRCGRPRRMLSSKSGPNNHITYSHFPAPASPVGTDFSSTISPRYMVCPFSGATTWKVTWDDAHDPKDLYPNPVATCWKCGISAQAETYNPLAEENESTSFPPLVYGVTVVDCPCGSSCFTLQFLPIGDGSTSILTCTNLNKLTSSD